MISRFIFGLVSMSSQSDVSFIMSILLYHPHSTHVLLLQFLRLRVEACRGPVLLDGGGGVAPPLVDHVQLALLPSVVGHVVHLDVVELQRGRGRRRRPRMALRLGCNSIGILGASPNLYLIMFRALRHTGLSKENLAKFSDTCTVRADGLCIGSP